MIEVSPQDRSRLARIAIIVAIVAGIATIVGVLWAIFYREGTEVADYRREATATCQQVRSIMTAGLPIGAIAIEPTGFIVADKGELLSVMRTRLRLSRAAFETLEGKPVPGQLSSAREQALSSQDAWYAAFEQNIEAVRQRVRRGDPASRVDELGAEVGFPEATVRLNSAMSSLGAEPCQILGGSQP